MVRYAQRNTEVLCLKGEVVGESSQGSARKGQVKEFGLDRLEVWGSH